MSVALCDLLGNGCKATVWHRQMPGADSYVISGSGQWSGSCDAVHCDVHFPHAPAEPICDFTVAAVRNGMLGPPSQPFCVPGVGLG